MWSKLVLFFIHNVPVLKVKEYKNQNMNKYIV